MQHTSTKTLEIYGKWRCSLKFKTENVFKWQKKLLFQPLLPNIESPYQIF